jgi:predicted nucleotidyltransferase
MITDADKKIIEQLARKYRAKRVVLFGSGLSASREYRDIDIAVEGIDGKDLCALSKPVDIIDLSQKTRFSELILREGIPLYG